MVFKNKRSNEFLLEGWQPLNESVNRWVIDDSLLESEERLSDLSEPERMVVGKKYEDETLKKLSKFGEVEVTNYSDDVFKKIDGFITFNDNDPALKQAYPGRVSVQIKRRVQGGKDIVFEVFKDIDSSYKARMGRDLRGVSDLYVVGQRNGTIGIFDNNRIKTEIVKPAIKANEEILDLYYNNNEEELKKRLGTSEPFRTANNGKVVGLVAEVPGVYQLRVTAATGERGEGFRKLMMFITFAGGNPIKIISPRS